MTIDDDIFGQLNYEYIWSKQSKINFFDSEVDVVILIDGEQDESFELGQYDAYKILIKNWNVIHETFLDFILEYYINKRRELGYDVEINENYPEISTKEDILKYITLVGINVPYEGLYGGRSIGISFDCSWDSENGLGLRLCDEKVVEVGYQDIAI